MSRANNAAGITTTELDYLKNIAKPGDYYYTTRKTDGVDEGRLVMKVVVKKRGTGAEQVKWQMKPLGTRPEDAISSRIVHSPTEAEKTAWNSRQVTQAVGYNILARNPDQPAAVLKLDRRVDGADHHYYWKRILSEEEESRRKKKDVSEAQRLRASILSAIARTAKSRGQGVSLQNQQRTAESIAMTAVEANGDLAQYNRLRSSSRADDNKRAALLKWSAATQMLGSPNARENVDVILQHAVGFTNRLKRQRNRPPIRSVPAKEREPIPFTVREPLFVIHPKSETRASPKKKAPSKRKAGTSPASGRAAEKVDVVVNIEPKAKKTKAKAAGAAKATGKRSGAAKATGTAKATGRAKAAGTAKATGRAKAAGTAKTTGKRSGAAKATAAPVAINIVEPDGDAVTLTYQPKAASAKSSASRGSAKSTGSRASAETIRVSVKSTGSAKSTGSRGSAKSAGRSSAKSTGRGSAKSSASRATVSVAAPSAAVSVAERAAGLRARLNVNKAQRAGQ